MAAEQAMPVRADDDAAWLLAQINALRASKGAAPFVMNTQLLASATAHSQYLANNVWRDPHVEANGSTPASRIREAGYTGSRYGENVYGGGLATASIAYNWWINEPAHYRGMVNTAFNEIGIGVVSGPYGRFFTTDFGYRDGSGAPTAPAVPPADPGQSAAIPAKPTRRSASPLPSPTPTLSVTPSFTFTPRPTRTSSATPSPQPPTATAIQIEIVAPASAAASPMQVAVLPTSAPTQVLPTANSVPPTPPPALKAGLSGTAIDADTPPATLSDSIRALLPLAIGLQAMIVAGLLLRRARH